MIETSLFNSFSSRVKIALNKLDDDNQMIFASEFKRKKKEVLAAYLWCLLLSPVAMFIYMRRIGLFWLFLLVCILTAGFGGIAWYLAELFIIPKRVRTYNEDLAVALIQEQKMLAA